MTEQELSEIEARANAATPGPWGFVPPRTEELAIKGEVHCDEGPIFVAAHYDIAKSADFEFAANAREDIPKLLAEVRRLREWKKRNNSMFITVSKRPYHCCANDCLDYVNNNLVYVELSKPVPHATDCPDFTVDGELK